MENNSYAYCNKKGRIVKAIQWTGDNTQEVLDFLKGRGEESNLKKEGFGEEEIPCISIKGLRYRALKGDYIVVSRMGLSISSEEQFHKWFRTVDEYIKIENVIA